MKKVIFTLLFAVMSMSAMAQFEQGTAYVGSSLTGLSMNYSKASDFNFGVQAQGGYFVADQWMLLGNLGYQSKAEVVSLAAGTRYYFAQNGIFVGGGLEFAHAGRNYVSMPIEAGYCFYLNRHVSIEPSIYYSPCFNDFSDGSSFGLKVGIGCYF